MLDASIDERSLVERTVPTAGRLRDEMDAAGRPPIRWRLTSIGPARCACCSSLMRRWSATVSGRVLTISERDEPTGPGRGVYFDVSDGERTEVCVDFDLADLAAMSWDAPRAS